MILFSLDLSLCKLIYFVYHFHFNSLSNHMPNRYLYIQQNRKLIIFECKIKMNLPINLNQVHGSAGDSEECTLVSEIAKVRQHLKNSLDRVSILLHSAKQR